MCPIRPSHEESQVLEDGWETPQQADVPMVNWDEHGQKGDHQDIVDIDDDAVVQTTAPMPSPITPTKAQVETHGLTHWPYRTWCPHCVAARRRNTQHRSVNPSIRRTVPLMVADYAFVKDDQDPEVCTILVVKITPSNLLLCIVVDEKGNNEHAVARLCRFIKESGYSKLVYRSDQERSIRSLFEEAFTQ